MVPEQPEPQSQGLIFDPNGPGMGLDVDFNNFDLGDIDAINVGTADFGVFSNFYPDGLNLNVIDNSTNDINNSVSKSQRMILNFMLDLMKHFKKPKQACGV
jgi:hypothetical protein